MPRRKSSWSPLCGQPLSGNRKREVVLSNTLGLNDCPDWVAQLLTEALFEAKHNENYISWAKASADGTRKREGRLRAELAAKKTPGTSPREFEEYVGKYFNSLKNIFIEVQLKGGRLSIAFSRSRFGSLGARTLEA